MSFQRFHVIARGRIRTIVLCGLLASVLPALAAKEFVSIDLKPKSNQKLKDNLHADASDGNNLDQLPRGSQTLEGVNFKIAEEFIQLGSTMLEGKPLKVEGIKVDANATMLHFLHATGFAAPDDTAVAEFVVNYSDKSKEIIPIVYGVDVRDWWYTDDTPGVTRAKIAWKGTNTYATSLQSRIRLYLTSWKNPKPDRKIETIDLVSKNTEAAPFVVAISAEKGS